MAAKILTNISTSSNPHHLHGTFEWLTNFDSFVHLLDPEFLFPTDGQAKLSMPPDPVRHNRNLRLLNIGCGSSALGERLQHSFSDNYTQVINVDRDVEVISFMQSRNMQRQEGSKNNRMPSCLKQCPNCQCTYQPKVYSDTDGAVITCASEPTRRIVNQWIELDFCNSDQCERHLDMNSFDVVLDKSTLDCALCSQDATSALMAQSYRSLRSNGGVLFLITFHSPQLIVPLLKYLYNNEIEYYTVDRMIDDYYYNEGSELKNDQPKTSKISTKSSQSIPLMFCSSQCRECYRESGRQHSSRLTTLDHKEKETRGYDKVSAKTVNVFICRKNIYVNDFKVMNGIDIEALQAHVLQVCNDWFMIENPLVTQVRENTLRHSFREKLGLLHNDNLDGLCLPLDVCYDIMFTTDEKSTLPYEYFLEDWNAFILDSSNTDEVPERDRFLFKTDNQTATKQDAMTLQVALTFLKAMQ